MGLPMSGEDGLDQLAVHAVVVDNQNLDHIAASRTGMHGSARLDNSQIQPNTGDAGGEENDGISPEAAQDSRARLAGLAGRARRGRVRGPKFKVLGTSNPELRVAPFSLVSPVSRGYPAKRRAAPVSR